jgi:hypothetical protein
VSAIYNVHRKPDVRVFTPDKFMFQHLARTSGAAAEPAPPMRYARPGERPPSTRPPGTRDDLIERFDAYAARLRRTN